MEPHSRLSQFNVRQPRAGPVTSNLRYMESQQKPVDPLENFKKRPDAPSRRSSSSSLYVSRPIATNSRVKQDEQYRQRGYLVFVNNALQQKKNGTSESFDELVDQFNPKKSTRCHSALVEAIVNMPWTVMDTTFVKSYTAFIGMLVSARPEYLSLVLGKTAHGFTYPHYSLIPTLPSTFPHKRQSQAAQITYIRNMLKGVLGTIVDRAIQIDESDDEDDEDGDGDNLSDLSSDAGGITRRTPALHLSTPGTPSSRSDSPLTPLEPFRRILRRQQFHMLLSIFDRTILRTFKSRYTQFLVFWYSSLDPEFSDLFQGMLVSKSLLEEDQPAVTRAAAASYIASFVSRAQFVDRESARRVVACLCNFLRSRLDIFDAVNTAGAAPPSMAHHSIFYAVAQAVDLLEDHEDMDEFTSAASGPAKKWMAELRILQRVIQSELNPLKYVCSSNVVMQFARVAHATDFLYCYTIMESNRRSDYAPQPPTPGVHGAPSSKRSTMHPAMLGHSMTTELNTFFPFDPYKLPRSRSYIQGVYREWSAVAIDDGEDEDDEDGDDEEEDEHAAEDRRFDGVSMVGGKAAAGEVDEADGLGESFGGMSISPYRPGSMAMSISVS
ncbi:RNA polymerase I-specific transcription initiation factor RRN3-domain-containing protein [Fomitopsis serialis]|uniref:RNA polymerase I-specific transcription initiation factor RRN3-domain-containing protein n=1 Tax=Fomitopsis serialis TaxID=139415 RepID=UPI0020076C49|nr:RNA polymerase I-specific transcription initiation factor RRN3-domain-containing protein [Neoantrodia serialis]KAH9937995.1 RNA polymerase I-specific transcription initiation factor RRN3-domain-containing protein [Neoantrodia serialis]